MLIDSLLSKFKIFFVEMLKSLKIRIYPDNEQKIYLSKLFGCSRVVYNTCLEKKDSTYANDKVCIIS